MADKKKKNGLIKGLILGGAIFSVVGALLINKERKNREKLEEKEIKNRGFFGKVFGRKNYHDEDFLE